MWCTMILEKRHVVPMYTKWKTIKPHLTWLRTKSKRKRKKKQLAVFTEKSIPSAWRMCWGSGPWPQRWACGLAWVRRLPASRWISSPAACYGCTQPRFCLCRNVFWGLKRFQEKLTGNTKKTSIDDFGCSRCDSQKTTMLPDDRNDI